MKKDLDPKLARRVALDFLAKTKGLYARSELAGSLRRNAPVVHDIDFAVIPGQENEAAWREEVKKRVGEIGGTVISFGEVISNFLYKGIQINLFICPGKDSWGTTLMWATGPKGHTIGMTIKARNIGLLINSQGIWSRDVPPRPIPAKTEKEVGRILHWTYKPPEERGKPRKKETSAY